MWKMMSVWHFLIFLYFLWVHRQELKNIVLHLFKHWTFTGSEPDVIMTIVCSFSEKENAASGKHLDWKNKTLMWDVIRLWFRQTLTRLPWWVNPDTWFYWPHSLCCWACRPPCWKQSSSAFPQTGIWNVFTSLTVRVNGKRGKEWQGNTTSWQKPDWIMICSWKSACRPNCDDLL